MKYMLLYILMLFNPISPETQLHITHDSFRVDNLGRLQVLKNGSLFLYSAKGKLLGHHSEQLLGRISSIDRNSSLKLLVFYKDVPAFQILDNTLSPHSDAIDLNEESMGNINAVCMSTNNTYWGYDGVDFSLIRFNDRYKVLVRSASTALTIEKVLDPVRMLEFEGRLYIADSEKGVYIFDQFGSYKRMIPYAGIIDMDIESDHMYLSDGKNLTRTDLQGIDSAPSLSKRMKIKSFDVSGNKIYIGDGDTIEIMPLDSLFD